MTDEELLSACKTGLNIAQSTTALNNILTQKIKAVKSFILGAGVSDDMLEDDLAVGVIVMGVSDLWNLQPGEIKFSPIFYSLITQLAMKSNVEQVEE